jgi:DNA-binding MarR family transcriptional regulator/energy-coupling factor transporter ATP-binding protein EcfA2
MRLGEILVGRGLVSIADIDRANERQRTSGGRLGENLVEMGLITPAQLDAIVNETPVCPRNIAETGIPQQNLLQLMLKVMLRQKCETSTEIADIIKLPPSLIQELIDDCIQKQFIQAVGSVTVGIVMQIRYTLSERGRVAALEAFNQNKYTGPAPIPLSSYQAQVLKQRITNELLTPQALRKVFEGLVVPEAFLQKAGPAVNAGKTLLMFGPPGNGKTTLATRIASIFDQTIYVPYCIEIDSQIIKIFDPSLHKRAVSEEQASTLGGRTTLRADAFDERWVACKRPFALTGGELTLDMLDLQMSPGAGYYEAPLHMKALNGTFLIDDFGRQQVSPESLLNRWIVPMESRVDYLKLNTGKSFMIPFDELLIFSTNLAPDDLMDPAFLRRIPYKIMLYAPSLQEYRDIFEAFTRKEGLQLTDEIFDYTVNTLTKYGYELAYYQPRFICDQVVAACKYESEPWGITLPRVAQALSNLYVKIAEHTAGQ